MAIDKNYKEFYAIEWNDWDKISKMTKKQLYEIIYSERSQKLILLISGFLIGGMIGYTLGIVK